MEQKFNEAYECGHCQLMSVVVKKEWRMVRVAAERLYDVYRCLACERELALEREMWEGTVMWGR